jgi:hypothetical protein
MQPVKVVNPYTSRPAGIGMLRLPDGSAFKVYYLDIAGRSEPWRYEWAVSGRDRNAALEQLRAAGISGVGFICLFPHVAKVFFFGECAETNLYAQAFRGDPFQEIRLDYARGVEVACAGEMDITAQEFELWRESPTVERYLERFVQPNTCGFTNHAKLREHAGACPA